MTRFNFKKPGPDFWKKALLMLAGNLLMGFFLSFLRCVGWGTDPYTFQNENIRLRLGWTLGNWQLLLNAILFIFVVIFNRRLIGLGTIANWVLIGYSADFFTNLWNSSIPPQVFTQQEWLWLKIIIFIAAIAGFVISASIYMNAQMGLSPYDAASFIISGWVTKIPFAVMRILYDLAAILIGILVTIGSGIPIRGTLPGSIIMALALGPMIQAVGRFMKKHLGI